jgi:hypothetical protein
MNGTRTLKLAANKLGQFFVHIYCADGTVCAEGPFQAGEEAVGVMRDIESGSYWAASYWDDAYIPEESY